MPTLTAGVEYVEQDPIHERVAIHEWLAVEGLASRAKTGDDACRLLLDALEGVTGRRLRHATGRTNIHHMGAGLANKGHVGHRDDPKLHMLDGIAIDAEMARDVAPQPSIVDLVGNQGGREEGILDQGCVRVVG